MPLTRLNRQLATTLVASLGLFIASERACASTLPSLDPSRGRPTVSLGIADLAFDVGLSDRLSVGLAVSYLPVGASLAMRSTWRGAPGLGGTWGLTGALGYGPPGPAGPSVWWLQPAWVQAFSLTDEVELRVSAGPLFYVQLGTQGSLPSVELYAWPILPNVELAYRIRKGQEWTIGGNSLVGYRMRF